jgi:hypothetical protein
MTAALAPTLSHRDLAVLTAVAAGRCRCCDRLEGSLTVDGLHLADQFVGRRLVEAGLVTAAAPGPVRLTDSGRALLRIA